MVDLHANETLVRTRMAEDLERAARHRRRRRGTAGLGRFLPRVGFGAARRSSPAGPGTLPFELDRAA